MPRRMILTDAERQNFLALPTDDDTLIRHWSLDDDDRRLLETRRRADTRLGLALQLCALRYPGRLVQRGELIPEGALAFLTEQLGIDPDALSTFARRAPTRYEQLAVLRQRYGFSELSHSLRADLLAVARGVAVVSTKDKYVVAALADEMRRRRIVIPGITVLERLAGQACTEAEEALFADVTRRLTPDLIVRMEALLGMGPRTRQSGVSWLREHPGKAGAAAMRGLIDRLEAVRLGTRRSAVPRTTGSAMLEAVQTDNADQKHATSLVFEATSRPEHPFHRRCRANGNGMEERFSVD